MGRERFDGDVDGAGAESDEEKPGKLASGAFGEEGEMLAGGYIQMKIFVVPGVVDAQGVAAGRNRNGDGIAEQEFGFALAVQGNDNLAGLNVLRRIARDGNFCGSSGSGGSIFLRHERAIRKNRRKREAAGNRGRKERRLVDRECRSEKHCARGVRDRNSGAPAR